MAVSSKVLTLSDEKAEVRLTIPVNSVLTEDLDVHTTTTQLRVRSRNGDIILDIPELYGTVDASRTVAVVRNGQLIITLYKLAPGEKWTSAAAAPEVVGYFELLQNFLKSTAWFAFLNCKLYKNYSLACKLTHLPRRITLCNGLSTIGILSMTKQIDWLIES